MLAINTYDVQEQRMQTEAYHNFATMNQIGIFFPNLINVFLVYKHHLKSWKELWTYLAQFATQFHSWKQNKYYTSNFD